MAAITGLYVMTTIVTNNAAVTEQAALTVQLGQALENRAQAYAASLDSNLSGSSVPPTGRQCGTNPAVCTSIVSDELNAAGTSRTLRVQADQVDGGLIMTRDVVIQATKASHISALDAKGHPTWVTVDGETPFTIWGVAAGQTTKVTEDQMKGPQSGTTWVTASARNGVDSAGQRWVYGANTACQAGTGAASTTPVSAAGLTSLTDVRTVIATTDTAFLLDATGTAYGYGNNTQGQLGLGRSGDQVCAPEAIKNHKFIAITTAGGSSFAIDTSHRLWAWGLGTAGQLGDGAKLSYNAPQQVAASTRFTAVATSGASTWALDVQGRIWSWGDNTYGQLGTGTTTPTATATRIPATTTFTQISAGATAFYGIDPSGQLWAAGNNANGALGDGTTANRSTPVKVAAGTIFVQVSGGQGRAFAIDSTGRLLAWGAGSSGALGTGDTSNKTAPTPVDAGSAKFRSVQTTVDGNVTAAVDTDGMLWAIGTNGSGLWPTTLSGNAASAQRMPRPTGFTPPSWK
ncbi:hypothetical protein [Leifsonia sp. TF02-11]|uniref:RCC1 domain-containing protein n=1 Tax=Leifsonia sp. TF02-11 TaxID=2815212 RepID=UPI001AA1893C|nr:hypothetical protein [Leifsonia sp. TF02-11]MBO1741039.1 hypothetical protein [Leifsonia sp. TF02-11]